MKTIKVQAEEFLQQPKGIKKSYLRVFFAYLISIIGFSIFLSLAYIYGPFGGGSEISDVSMSKAFFINSVLNRAVAIISIVCFCLMVFPFVCLFSLWIIGVNQVSKSPIFHFFLWLISFLLISLLLITMILFIRSAVYTNI